MSNKTINISLPASMADFIQKEVKKGEYVSMSDFFRSLVRGYQSEHKTDVADDLLRRAVHAGIESGESKPFNMGTILHRAQERTHA